MFIGDNCNGHISKFVGFGLYELEQIYKTISLESSIIVLDQARKLLTLKISYDYLQLGSLKISPIQRKRKTCTRSNSKYKAKKLK